TKYKGQDLGSLKGSGLVKKYRQHQAETATFRLAEFVGKLGNSPLHCQFVTEVRDGEGPADAIDKYGRFVGNVLVGNDDINLAILRRGWAVVALYNSMTRSEIEDCLAAWKVGRAAPGGIARYLTKTIGAFNPKLTYRGGAGAKFKLEGTRKFIHPKLYRRQCTWWAYRTNGTFKPGFDTFLTLSKHDVFYELAEFLDDAPYTAVQIPIEKMVEGGKKVVYRPEQVVFKDAPSTLYGADGKKLERW
ncbi:MAG: thermonuclease family protein, partial [Acidobacteriota bacterium]